MQTQRPAGADILRMEISRCISPRRSPGIITSAGTATAIRPSSPARHHSIAARVSALADVFDALTHTRRRRRRGRFPTRSAEIASLKGKQFDPESRDISRTRAAATARARRSRRFLAVEAKNSPFIKARKQIAEALKGTTGDDALRDAPLVLREFGDF